MSQTEQQQPREKIKIKISDILNDLSNGLDRKTIRAKYGLSASDAARLFQHDKLKGARVRVAPAFEVEDDVEVKEKAPKTSKATITSDAASKPVAKAKETASAPQAEATATAIETEETEEEAAVIEDDTVSEGIKEVQGPGDQDADATKTTTKSGLW